MADIKWTSEQQKVISLRGRNILVSAAAGSGKTAVLVERIIQKITDKEKPVDIDKILVVTFTKAAAAEMRGRISEAIEKKRQEFPEDDNLEKQSVLVHNAQITTIDSFCLFVVRNYFEEIGLDPNFRIADTGEIKLLEMDVLDEVFARNYEAADNEGFLQLIDAYSNKKGDSEVRDMVSKIYRTSASDSWPRQWIESLYGVYNVSSSEELLETKLMKGIVQSAITSIRSKKPILEACLNMALTPGGPLGYAKTLQEDLAAFERVEELDSYDSVKEFLAACPWKTIGRCSKDVNEDLKNRTQKNRTAVKDELKELRSKYFERDLQELVDQLGRMRPYVGELVRLSVQYLDAMEEAKKEKRILDFADVEHNALKILVDEETKEIRPAALEFRKQFEEIMIDEYQDSNQVQEDILSSISREAEGMNNMFMVGDVKQSIYRFRLARPELFMGKYKEYTTEDSPNQRIDLYDNFRSRTEVVNFVNDIFYKIMAPDIGNVIYDEDAALHFHATYPEGSGFEPEFLFLDKSDEELMEVLDEEDDSKKLEALMIANRIKTMLEDTLVTDKDTKELRPARFSDIVILLRSMTGWGDIFAETLKECGIPAYVEASTGYFSAYEVQVVLAMLKILDNPYQDIPMVTVLKSPIVGLDDEELAEISVREGGMPFAYKAMAEMEEGNNEKLAKFYEIFMDIRAKLSDTPVHSVINEVLEKTGFGFYAAAMPAGTRRQQNLDMLIEKALAFESTSYKGLYHFVRYIDQLQKYEVDFGEADAAGEDENLVKIMTIHKSKGLEFPIVFVSGTGKQFNEMDGRQKLVIHSDLGLGIDEFTGTPRTKQRCFARTEVVNRILMDGRGEELRVLYVALTRAKEKLVITGVTKDGEKLFENSTGDTTPKLALPFDTRKSAKSFLEILMPAILSYPGKYAVGFIGPEELAKQEAEELARLDVEQSELLDKINSASDYDIKELTKYFDFSYEYKTDSDKKRKYSVSDLKHMSMEEKYEQDQTGEKPKFLSTEWEPYVPVFATGEVSLSSEPEANPGALRGTAVHRVMECLDFAAILQIDREDNESVKEFVQKQLEHQLKNDMITEEMHQLVMPSMIESFVKSSVGLRMAQADARGQLYKEKPFVMRAKEGYLVQGIIDVFWFEGDDIILLDYKTDRVDTAQELVKRYKTQLDLYGDALSRIYSTEGKDILTKECLIYSFRLQEVINL